MFTENDDIWRTSELLAKNVKERKTYQIIQEIGRQPVLAFGNSKGDVSMATFTVTNNPYRSAAFMLIADDEVRENGNAKDAASARAHWEQNGWNVISMRDDFKHIYKQDRTA